MGNEVGHFLSLFLQNVSIPHSSMHVPEQCHKVFMVPPHRNLSLMTEQIEK